MLYLDCSSGVSGDMLIGALIDLEADFENIKEKLSGIADLSVRNVKKAGVNAKKFDAKFKLRKRKYVDLDREIQELNISEDSKILARNILRELALAESKAHGEKINKVHLHDAIDCIVDSVAISLALEDLELMNEKIYCSAVSVGELAPATLDIIRRNSIPIKFTSNREITTPTGAAILSNIVTEFKDVNLIGKEGYGAGEMDLERPNVLKAILGNEMVLLETNIDDCTPEIISYVMERVMDEGALDVHVVPVMMKKGRLGHLIRILTDSPEKFSRILMEETGTLGVRVLPITHRFEVDREIEEVTIKIGNKRERIRIKKSKHGSKPEFEDIRRISKKYKKTYREILEKLK